MTPKIFPALYLAEAYRDAQADFERSLNDPAFPRWDEVIITASDEAQAAGYRIQLAQRRLPAGTRITVLPDEGGRRVGSGGATLSAIRYLRQNGGTDGKRILLIHSGGDSKRVPQYSALGKLFSPVPHLLEDGRPSTLFDELMIAVSPIPAWISSGMLLLSGDVLLLCNPLAIRFHGHGAAAVSFMESAAVGRHHGVYLAGTDGTVRQFLHKQSVRTLTCLGAVSERGEVCIDTGAMLLGTDVLRALDGLIDTEENYRSLVNERVRLSLYGDFQYPMAADSTPEAFRKQTPEGDFCPELISAREKLWTALRPFRMRLLCLSPAKFVHFGTSREISRLMSGGVDDYRELNWSRQVSSSLPDGVSGWNAAADVGTKIGKNCYLENCYLHRNVTVGNGCIVSGVEPEDGKIPSGAVIHALRQRDGRYVCRIFGVRDNPKQELYFGKKPSEWMAEALWPDGSERTLWKARLYPVCETLREAVRGALAADRLLRAKDADPDALSAWKRAERKSLYESFRDADPEAAAVWERQMGELVQMGRIAAAVAASRPASEIAGTLGGDLTERQRRWLEQTADGTEGTSEAMRLYRYVGRAMGGAAGERERLRSFELLREAALRDGANLLREDPSIRIVRERYETRLPLRVNWGGGWTDTPPYCCENGGTVLNVSVRLNGQLPVRAALERIEERKIIFDSRDMDVHGEFESLAELRNTGDPADPFALQKAALLVCGLLPPEGGSLEEVLNRIGGGFVLHSEVTGVPKGSGLGTSSILAAACVRALMGFFGLACRRSDLYRRVLLMEQMMSTGGGWQDQVGGLSGGIRYITSEPGLRQHLRVERVDLDAGTRARLQERFCLIYTGQRRLARHLLRSVMGRYLDGEPDCVRALRDVRAVAERMRRALETGDVDGFARLLDEHWTLSRTIDAGSSNALIDRIFGSIDDLIDARMVCGAGGGGFLQVMLKRDVPKETLRQRLRETFPDSGIDLWDCELM